MSVDMNSQGSDSNEEDYDPNCEEEEEDEDPGDIEDYYVGVASDVEQQGADAFDPEEYQFTCLTYRESESTLNERMASLASTLKVRKGFCLQRGANGATWLSRQTLQSEVRAVKNHYLPELLWMVGSSQLMLRTYQFLCADSGPGVSEKLLTQTSVPCNVLELSSMSKLSNAKPARRGQGEENQRVGRAVERAYSCTSVCLETAWQKVL